MKSRLARTPKKKWAEANVRGGSGERRGEGRTRGLDVQVARHGVSTAQGGGHKSLQTIAQQSAASEQRVDFPTPGGVSPRVCAQGTGAWNVALIWGESSPLLVTEGTA